MAKEEELLQPEAQETPAPAEPEGAIRVGEDADDDDVAAAAPEASPDRPGRRQQFGALKKQAKEWEQKYAALEREVAEIRGRQSAPQAPVFIQPRGDQSSAVDPAEAAIDSIQSQQDAILLALQTPNLPQAETDRLRKQWYKADRERQAAIVRAEHAKLAARAAPAADDVDMRVGAQILQSKFPKLYENSYYRDLAVAETNRLAGERRQRVTLALAEEAAQIVYAKHGLGSARSAPTASERAKYESTGTRPASNASGGDVWVPTKLQKKMAEAYTSHLPNLTDKQRQLRWYNEVGKPNKLV